MPCYRPLKAFQGGKDIYFDISKVPPNIAPLPIQLPCGQCIGCRIERTRQWAIRIMHEASQHDDNCFVTLTYSDDNMPQDFGLQKSDWQNFAKRLRKEICPKKIRYYHCGEYGDLTMRPHYHAIIFGFAFPDKKKYITDKGSYYASPMLAKLWPYGNHTIGNVEPDSAMYVAGYVQKKITGKMADEHYAYIDRDTGEVLSRSPEYATMSRRPGIGKCWIDKYGKETYRDDSVIFKGYPSKPPRYYDGKYEILYPSDFEAIKQNRINKITRKMVDDNTENRLLVRQKIAEAKRLIKKRSYENE